MKRTLAGIAAGALLLGGVALTTQAADSIAPGAGKALASAQPRFSGYRLQEIRDWSPQTDPHSSFLRAAVPLQERIAPLAATQADPSLNGEAEVMLMQGDYGNSFFDTPMANNDFSNHTLNFWQYVDYFSPWHGAATASTPSALYDPATSDWRNRGFEFGIVNIPNPAYTNAAHRNGVKSVATIYFDPAFRPGLTFTESFAKDPESHGYVIAEKLMEMAQYYGFDGYFLNQEEQGDDSEFKPFMAHLTSQGLYTQWYDTNSYFNASKAAWLKDAENGQIHDSVFVNYGWPNNPDVSLDYAATTGVDPHDSLFFGVEANQGKFSGSHPSAAQVSKLYAPGTHNPRASMALFTPSDYYQRGLDDDVKLPALTGELPLMQQDAFQWMITERERMYFSGVKEDPRDTGKVPGFTRADVGVADAAGWVGVADFTPERSVIDGDSFHSSFNTGHGMQWFDDGVAAGEQWTDINSQAILPSWQWWVDTEGTRPSVDFDYGATLPRKSTTGADLASPFAPQGAWDGGSSLVIHGDMTAPTTLRLFKTDLALDADSRMEVTFKKSSSDAAAMRLAVVFADAPTQVVTVDVASTVPAGDWVTSTVDLSAHEGRRIATIGLEFDAAEGYQMNIGDLTLSSGADAPAAPDGFRVTGIHDDGQVFLAWDKAPFDAVDSYVVEAVDASGATTHLSSGYADVAYGKDAPTSGKVTYSLRAIGKDGTSSAPALLEHDFTAQPRDLAVAQAPTSTGLLVQAKEAGVLDVSWTAGSSAGRTCRVQVDLLQGEEGDINVQPYGVDVPCADGAATVSVPVREGYPFDLTVTPEGTGRGLTVRGHTRDTGVTPMPVSDFEVADGKLVVHTPTTKDWWKIAVSFVADGADDAAATPIFDAVRGDRASAGMQKSRALPATTGTVLVKLTDYSGNTLVSRLPVVDGGLAAETAAPVFTVTPATSLTVTDGTPVAPVSVSVADASPVTLHIAADLPEGLRWMPNMEGTGGTLSGTPPVGVHGIEFRAVDWFGNSSSVTVTVTVTKKTPPASPSPSASPSASPSSSPSTSPSVKPSTPTAADVYTTPGFHFVNGRHWYTTCEAYSVTQRCRTNIWATQIRVIDGAYAKVNGWVFNNLTYLPSPRSVWAGNPLGRTTSWTASDGRAWRTECDTAATGRNGCRSYARASVIEERRASNGKITHVVVDKMVFNNIVLFR
ncbi:MAG: endo-beta-N-acetylglucosaminidase [Arachnia sp.]